MKLEEAKNFVEIFDVCMAGAEGRTESRESFYRSDYPDTDNKDWFCWHTVRKTAAGTEFLRERIPTECYRRRPPVLADLVPSPLAINLGEARKRRLIEGQA